MPIRRFLLVLVPALLASIAVSAGDAVAKDSKETVRVCTTKKVGKRDKKVCKRVPEFQGHNAARDSLRVEPLDHPSGDIAVRAKGVDAEIAVNIYRPDGTLDEGALAQLDEVFRCRRSGEVRAIDPRLYEMLSRIYDHFGRVTIDLVSGFRFKNEKESSRHHHASAMDIKIEGVSIKDLRDFAETLDQGGMGIGIYPTSGFVHVDFRAPGEPSYRWTDLSGPDSDKDRGKDRKDSKSKDAKKDGKDRGRTKPARKPTS